MSDEIQEIYHKSHWVQSRMFQHCYMLLKMPYRKAKCHRAFVNVLQVPLSTNVRVLMFQILVDSFAWQEEIHKDYLSDIILVLQKAYTEGSYL